MHLERQAFHENLNRANRLIELADSLDTISEIDIGQTELYRAHLVNSLSTLDKFIHDLVRSGIIQMFSGSRLKTPKYSSNTLSLDIVHQLQTANQSEQIAILDAAIFQKLKTLSFLQPDKICDAISFIWDEKKKWDKIEISGGSILIDSKRRLKLYVERRNSIVHEADLNPVTGRVFSITRDETVRCNELVSTLGQAIYDCVL